MSWGFPYAFLFLLGVVPLILFLNSLRPRGVKIKTTALFLWERVLKERPVGKRLGQLLKHNLLLILQLLVGALLIGALSDPSLLRHGAPMSDTVVVIDLSASMKAGGGSGSRFDAALNEFLSLIDSMGADHKVMVIGAGSVPRLLAPFTSDKGRLKDLGRSLQATDAPGKVKEAILFAHQFLKRGSSDQVVVISDAAFEGAEELPWHSPHLRLVRVDGGERNVGITGFEVRRLPGSATHEMMVRIKNFTPAPIRAPFALTLGRQKLVNENLELGPEESRVLVYPYQGAVEGKAEALLAIEDDFPTDNRAFLVLSETPMLRVLYLGRGNPFLDHLFRSFPRVQVTHMGPSARDQLSSKLREYDLVIVDGIPAPPMTQGNFLLVNTIGEGIPLSVRGKILRPRPLPMTARHPLTDGVRLDDLYIREALRLVPTGDGITLARSQEGPLIFAVEKGKLRSLIFGFDLSASDLPFRVAFPVLFSNALEWFHPNKMEFPAAQVQSGKPYAIHVRPGDDQVEVRSPSGKREVLAIQSNPFPFDNTWEAGFYHLKTKSEEGQFAVNLFSESESQINPRVRPEGKTADKQSGGRMEAGLSLWPVLLAVAFFLLGVEGFLAFRYGGSFYPVAFRSLALTALVIALVNPRIFKPTEALDVILGVDFSHSVGQEGKDKALQILEEARRIMSPHTRAGLLFFGRRPAWEFFPRADFKLADFSPSVEREETDMQAALQASLAQIGEGRQGRVLLISDGNENRGEVARVVPLLRSHGVPVWVLPLSSSRGRNEIYLSDLVLPHQVDSAESFEVKGAIESLSEASARVKLLVDGVMQTEETLALKKGTQWIGFKQSFRETGSHTFELLVESQEDTFPENNRLQGVVEVKGPPRVLYLSQGNSQRIFSRVLGLQGYSVTEATPEQRSLSLPELSAFDLVILDNVPAYHLSQAKMELIERYVRDLGGGLIVIGGPQSYGAGGYYRTPLERILPVEMRPPSRLDIPHVVLLFVLDKSGSMAAGPPGATKLDLAKAAAMAAADLLNPSDQVGILAFDAAWDWALPFLQVGKGEIISEKLSSLQSDGGTDLYKALVEAHRSFSAKAAAIKHILVLSDGLTDKADFSSLVKRMAREGITVSSVALGQDADAALMRDIAKEGKGRAYMTVDPRTIPQIFTTETLLISRELLVEKLSYVKMTAGAGPLKGFSQKKLPPLRGYVLTHPKPRAELLMKIEEDPLLVSWRYGLGTVVAFTSDLSGRWGKDWVGWNDFPQWGAQLARSAMKRISENKIRAELRQEGEEVRAVVDFLSNEGGFVNHLKLKANWISPEQAPLVRPFQQTAPGRYETSFSAPQRGIHLLTVSEDGEKGEAGAITTFPFIAPYPREYRDLKANTALLSRLAEETGGEVLGPDHLEEGLKRFFTPEPGRATSSQETWWALSGLGLLLFLSDLALRALRGMRLGSAS